MTPVFSQGCVAARLDDLVGTRHGGEPGPHQDRRRRFRAESDRRGAAHIAGDKVRSLLIEVNQNLADRRQMVEELTRSDTPRSRAGCRRGTA